ncbi:MAG TPA: type II toxin-antitoxin system RelE/ParE family toxin [Thermoanaerobaculia bacterium]|nr:type II toxin-antitoxin system RelE/ParE family toxin [Thermoanaerobaculia bacterium]
MREPRFHPAARLELREAVEYFERKTEGLGARFNDEVESAVSQIREYPSSAPILEDPVRKKVLRKFPYNILYFAGDEEVFILAVMNQKRRPGYWKWRLDERE